MFFRYTTSTGSSGLNSLKCFTVGNPTAYIINNFSQSDPHGHFYQTGIFYFTSQTKNFCSFTGFSPNTREPFGTFCQNGWNIRIGFHIIIESRFTPYANLCREWWFNSWLTSFSFDGFNQRCLFATYKCPGTHSDFQIKGKTGIHNVFSKQSQFLSLFNSFIQSFYGEWVLCPDINITFVCPYGIAGNCHGL